MERDRGPRFVPQVCHVHNLWVDNVGKGCQESLEVGEEGRVVERPFGRGLWGASSARVLESRVAWRGDAVYVNVPLR